MIASAPFGAVLAGPEPAHLTPLAVIGVNLVVALGMLVIVPLGLRLLEDPRLDPVRRFWLVGAVPGAVSLWLPRGPLATGLAVVYALVHARCRAARQAPAAQLRVASRPDPAPADPGRLTLRRRTSMAPVRRRPMQRR